MCILNRAFAGGNFYLSSFILDTDVQSAPFYFTAIIHDFQKIKYAINNKFWEKKMFHEMEDQTAKNIVWGILL